MENNTREALDYVEKKEFSNFASKVRQTLEDKLRNHPTIKQKVDDFKRYEDAMNKFKEISGRD